MPNAAAASYDDDFGYDEPVRKKAGRKPRAASGSSRKKKKGGRFDMSRVARYGAIVMSATVALGIMYNALVAQKGHHPAPLFGKPTQVAQRSPVAAPAASKPTPRASAAQDDGAEQQTPRASVVAAKTRRPTPQRADDQGDDAIARLLQTGSSASASDKPDSKTVSGAQKALIKLGFSVKATGTIGPATRKAIESFERNQHMPVKGELTRRVVKVLSAESGVKID